MPSASVLAVIVLLSLSLVGASTHYSPSVLDGQRILVGIVQYEQGGSLYFERLLIQLVQACEYGADITIVVATTMPWNNTLLTRPGWFLCTRTMRDVPIIIQQHDKSLGMKLNGETRHVFLEHMDDFDFFLHTENDLSLTVASLSYLVSETLRLSDSKLIPGILRFEIHHEFHRATVPWPDNKLFLGEGMWPLHVLRFRSRLYISKSNHYYGGFFLSRQDLKTAVARANQTNWVLPPDHQHDYGGEWFSGLWVGDLGWLYVTPVENFHVGLGHHMADKGANAHPLMDLVHKPEELKKHAFVQHLVDLFSPTNPWFQCVTEGHYVTMELDTPRSCEGRLRPLEGLQPG